MEQENLSSRYEWPVEMGDVDPLVVKRENPVSNRVRRSSPTPGRATGASNASDTVTNPAASAPPGRVARIPAVSYPACIASPRWSSGGCSALTRAQ